MKAIAFAVVLSLLLLSTVLLAEESSDRRARIDAPPRTENSEPGNEASRTDELNQVKKTSKARLVQLKSPVSRSAKGNMPGLMNYQGLLTDENGAALDTTVSMTLSIYTDSTGGSQVWTETQPSVAVDNGMFNVQPGRVNSIPKSAFEGSSRWLGVQVEDDAELQPRQRIAAVGYAFRAAVADSVAPPPVDTTFIQMQCDLLIWAGDSVATIYAGMGSYGPGDLSKSINDFGYSYFDKFDDVLQSFINDLDPLVQPIPQQMLDSTRVWAQANLDAYAASLDSAFAAEDTVRLRQIDAETRDHELDRVTSTLKEMALNINAELDGGGPKGWIDDLIEKVKKALLKSIDKILEDIPGIGDACKKISDTVKDFA